LLVGLPVSEPAYAPSAVAVVVPLLLVVLVVLEPPPPHATSSAAEPIVKVVASNFLKSRCRVEAKDIEWILFDSFNMTLVLRTIGGD